MLNLVIVLGFVAMIVRALIRGPLPADTKWKRIKTYTRVPWSPKEIDVPDDR